MDQLIASQQLQIERKLVTVECRENDQGRFLRIIEEAHGRRNMVIIPGTGCSEFAGALAQMAAHAHPPQNLTPA